ncbi:hypothetical protein [Acrocarpospora sp. B8E8]|uniref:hypothetical protein n=1 Tax=Acrocarpospora sp. B8E8 TaxID=3153572 RepID=UPI00325F0ED0
MRIRKFFGVAAATAILATGMVGFASTAANASTQNTLTASSPDWEDDSWGAYYSKNHKAKAKGWIDVDYYDDEDNKVRVGGKLWDYDHSNKKCAYVVFRYTKWSDHEDDWYTDYVSYKECGWDKKFSFTRYDVSQVQVKVCQIDKWSSYPYKCGYWKDIYNAYDDDYGYDEDYWDEH